MILKARSSTASTMLPSGGAYAVQTAVNGGSGLLIFVLQVAHSHNCRYHSSLVALARVGHPFPAAVQTAALCRAEGTRECPGKTAERKKRRVLVDGDTNEIDPAWWSDAFGVAGVDEHAPPERLSLEFQRLLGEPNLGETQRQVLEALAAATSATLKTGDWQQPFRRSWNSTAGGPSFPQT
jgi:hypothetical protein